MGWIGVHRIACTCTSRCTVSYLNPCQDRCHLKACNITMFLSQLHVHVQTVYGKEFRDLQKMHNCLLWSFFYTVQNQDCIMALTLTDIWSTALSYCSLLNAYTYKHSQIFICSRFDPWDFYMTCIINILFYPQSAFYPSSAVCSLHFMLSLNFTPGLQSVFYTDRVTIAKIRSFIKCAPVQYLSFSDDMNSTDSVPLNWTAEAIFD